MHSCCQCSAFRGSVAIVNIGRTGTFKEDTDFGLKELIVQWRKSTCTHITNSEKRDGGRAGGGGGRLLSQKKP